VRAMPPAEIADAARSLGVDVEVVSSVPDALARAIAVASEDDLVLVAGSLYVVGEARATFARHG
jgi:folylpolyglutamate synthase/dihydropteroate synthase